MAFSELPSVFSSVLSRLTTSEVGVSSSSAKTGVEGRIDEKEITANKAPKRDNAKRFNSGNFVFIVEINYAHSGRLLL